MEVLVPLTTPHPPRVFFTSIAIDALVPHIESVYHVYMCIFDVASCDTSSCPGGEP